MKLNKENWFKERNIRGYSQIEERIYFLENSTLTDNERTYEVSVIEKLVEMIPDTMSKIKYSNKLHNINNKTKGKYE